METTFKDKYGNSVSYDSSDFTDSLVFETLMEEYFIPFNAFSSETICQNDDCQIYASEVLANIADKIFKVKYND